MKKIIIANLKMNLTLDEMVNYKNVVEEGEYNDLIICPSYLYLQMMKSKKYEISAQDAYYIDKGAFTGEVSFYQLKSTGIKYSLIGHSERRHVFNEGNEIITMKMKSCISNGIIPILCVGETKEERETGDTFNVIDKQIDTALEGLNMSNTIIAYEPVWSIGTGMIPELGEIEEIHLHIKQLLNKKYNTDSKVLYGGSVKLDNIEAICGLSSVDGVLIGGASNNPNTLINMYNIVEKM